MKTLVCFYLFQLQMDNCFRENKNKYLLAVGLLLVELGIYKSVGFFFKIFC